MKLDTVVPSAYHNIQKFIEFHRIKGALIHDDLSVSVDGDVMLTNTDIKKIPIKFKKVTGDFYVNETNITSLENAPEFVGGDFSCSGTNVISLEHAPKTVGGHFDCSETPITSLQGAPRHIRGSFVCSDTKINSLEHVPHTIEQFLICNDTNIVTFKDVHKLSKVVAYKIICSPATNMLGLTLLNVKHIETENDDNRIGSILSQHIGDPLAAQEALLDAGFIKEAKL